MPKYPFLSDEWIAEARKIREANTADAPPITVSVRMNQVVIDVPFGEGTVHAHMDSTNGAMEMDLGHMENPELTVTLDYVTARAILVDNNPQAGMQAFMAGKIKVEGDMTKLMALQQVPTDPAAMAAATKLAAEIQAITED